jgi:DNA polymerase I-like protein with 3'-5' exonuclease and polymerase domains
MVTLPLLEVLREKVELRGKGKLAEHRRKLQSIVFNMEQTGVPISKSRTAELKEQYTNTSAVCNNICVNISGGTLEQLPGGVSNQLREVVFNQLGLKSSAKTDSGKPSLDKNVIKEWLTTLPQRSIARTFVENLYGFRKRSTALGFMDSYERFWVDNGDSDLCKLFSSVNPTGTDTLRWSSQNPNNQQISKQEIEEFNEYEVEVLGKKNRSAKYMFGPEPGREWWSCDASNIELRIPAYKAGEDLMIELFERPNDPPYFGSNHLLFFSILHPDKYDHDDPKGLLVAKKKYAATWYQWTKNGDFAVQYGAVAESGTADRAYNVVGGQAKIESRLTNIKKYSQFQIKYAQKHGYVETVPDKTVDPYHGYPLLCTRSKWGKIVETVPLSYHVQGTAMWWMCQAMIRVQEYLDELNRKCKIPNHYRIAIQVHDELVFDFPKGRGLEPWKTNLPIMRNIKRLMEMGGEGIDVPTPINCEYHEHNWQEGRSIAL